MITAGTAHDLAPSRRGGAPAAVAGTAPDAVTRVPLKTALPCRSRACWLHGVAWHRTCAVPAALGVGPDDLATVVVTHIHLDHAGGVGDIAGMYPSAEIVVHEFGARHLADPSRLMASARMVYGDDLDWLFGELAPTPAERIR